MRSDINVGQSTSWVQLMFLTSLGFQGFATITKRPVIGLESVSDA